MRSPIFNVADWSWRRNVFRGSVVATWLVALLASVASGQPRNEPQPSPLVEAPLQDADWRRGESALGKAVSAAAIARSTGDVVGEALATGLWARSLVVLRRIPEAVVMFRTAATIWQQTGYRHEYVKALLEVPLLRVQSPVGGTVFHDADRSFKEALNVAGSESEQPLLMAWTLAKAGDFFEEREAFGEAEELLRTSLELRERYAPESVHVAHSLSSLGALLKARGDRTAAREAYRRALTIYERHQPESLWVAGVLHGLGAMAEEEGDLEEARRRVKASLALCERFEPTSFKCSHHYHSLGIIASREGNLAEARRLIQKALELREQDDPGGMAVGDSLDDLAWVMIQHGDLVAARSYAERGLAVRRRHKQPFRLAANLETLGNLALLERDFEAALRHNSEAVALRRQAGQDSLHVAYSLFNMGAIEERRDNSQAALGLYIQARQLFERLAPDSTLLAGALEAVGRMAVGRGELSTARASLIQALALQNTRAPTSMDTASVLDNLAALAYREGNFGEAEDWSRKAWMLVREQASVIVGDETRQAFGASVSRYVRFLAMIQARREDPASFVTLEEGKAYALRQLLLERRVLGGIEEDRLLAAYRAAARTRERAEAALTWATAAADRAEKTLREVSHVEVDEAKLKEPRAAVPAAKRSVEVAGDMLVRARVEADQRWTDLQPGILRFAPPPLSADQLREAIPAGTMYLSFAVTPAGTLLFVLEPGAGETVPVRIAVIPLTEREITKRVQDFVTQLTNRTTSISDVLVSGRTLFETLFPFPELRRDVLASRSRLIISPDGPLWDVPFAALVTNEEGAPQYLGAIKRLSYTPSLTLLHAARQPARSTSSPTPVALVVGNPMFERQGTSVTDDERFRGGCAVEALPGTQREAEEVARLYSVEALTGERATETNVRAQISNADIVHLATHGCLHPVRAMASSLLLTVPAQPQEAEGTGEDGMLQAWEIASQLRLKAGLVVLSACETGRGEIVGSEGIAGLSRALQVAGAQAVVASQWKVNDASTATLMVALHGALRQGMDAAAALQQAMAQVRDHPATQHPFHWAAFRVMGEFSGLASAGAAPLSQDNQKTGGTESP